MSSFVCIFGHFHGVLIAEGKGEGRAIAVGFRSIYYLRDGRHKLAGWLYHPVST